MSGLSLTYSFGQIKPEYRGNLALFASLGKEGAPHYRDTLILDEHPLFDLGALIFRSEGIPLKFRTYIGVNEKAKPRLLREFGNARVTVDLDKQIVEARMIDEMIRSLRASR